MSVILVTGSYGQLGSEIKELSSDYKELKFLFTDVDTLDITNLKSLENFFNENPIDFVINCAGYTNVDKAETDKDAAYLINATAVKYLAELTNKKSAGLIHISTDYVFDGTGNNPYKENDATNPTSVYGETKLQGELEILAYTPLTPLKRGIVKNSIIIRTSWLYSSYGNNFVKTMLRLGKEKKELNVVSDQTGCPTYAKDLAKVILDIINNSYDNSDPDNVGTGIYHYSNEGVCSWYDFASEIFKIANISCKINPIGTKDFPTPAKRPFYSVLNKSKIKSTFGITIPHWKDSLKIGLLVD